MEPNSVALIVTLLVLIGALFFVFVRFRAIAARGVAGLLIVAMSALTGMSLVNDYYGYYTSWSQLSADLSGDYTPFATTVTSRTLPTHPSNGYLKTVQLPGPRSHISRRGLVYLPPQYFEPAYAHTTFPVLELVHGSPGGPDSWIVQLSVVKLMDELIARHQIGPMLLVMPTMYSGSFQECVDAPGAADDTYISEDVRTDVLGAFRASPVPAEWGIAGYSSGGYCAADLSLRHPALFGAAGMMDGYFRAQDGPAAQALHGNAAAEAANNPLTLAAHLGAGTHPLPAFWLAAGTGDAGDYAGAKAFVAALHGIEQVALYTEAGAGHNFYDWSAAVPTLLSWMWTQLAPPQLRVDFPIAGTVRNGALIPPPHAGYHPKHHHHGTPVSSPAPSRPAASTATSTAASTVPARRTD